ncbi:MAG TPA: hypothetical protein PK775_09115 [Rectinema sp.]|nr:hypothetical protein [Rectinema sp.]HQL17439.1 hypothetical protein [Rectinema sp.]HQO46241.1 hypothetical protein [Rectinema sp.]HQQ72359.1 hypothetical protein [Rectinema sp.]
MLNLEQVRALEARVEKAVVLITKLRQENADLESQLADITRAEELLRNQNAELERQNAAQIRLVTEISEKLESLSTHVKEAEEKLAQAELKAAEAEERAATMERKAQGAEEEIARYRDRALSAERRIAEMEAKAEELKSEQDKIEQGLIQALSKLDSFEDMVLEMSIGSNPQRDRSLAQAEKIFSASEGLSRKEASDKEVASEKRGGLEASEPSLEGEAQEMSESSQGGGDLEEPADDSQPDSESQNAPFRGGQDELDIF